MTQAVLIEQLIENKNSPHLEGIVKMLLNDFVESILITDEIIEGMFWVNEDRMSSGDTERMAKQDAAKWCRDAIKISALK